MPSFNVSEYLESNGIELEDEFTGINSYREYDLGNSNLVRVYEDHHVLNFELEFWYSNTEENAKKLVAISKVIRSLRRICKYTGATFETPIQNNFEPYYCLECGYGISRTWAKDMQYMLENKFYGISSHFPVQKEGNESDFHMYSEEGIETFVKWIPTLEDEILWRSRKISLKTTE